MLRLVTAVAAKELRDGWRDRRSLAAAMLYPLLGPLVVGLALTGLARDREERRLVVPVQGAARAPSLVAHLEQEGAIVEPAPGDPLAAVREGRIALAVVVSADYPGDFSSSRPARVELVHDGARSRTRVTVGRVRELLEAYSRRTGDLRLLARGISPRVVRALAVAEVDVSSAAARAGFALATLPIFLLTAAFVSSMGLSIDVTAGERERRSLEPLLLTPAPPVALALGKWLACAVPGMAGAGITVMVVAGVLRWEGVQALDVRLGLGPAELLPLLALLLPTALLAPALQMLLAVFSRSYKEAQTQLSLLLFLPMLPGFLFAFGAARTAPWMGIVPVLGQQVLMSEVLSGAPPAIASLASLGALTTLAALVTVAVTGALLRRERIVFGS